MLGPCFSGVFRMSRASLLLLPLFALLGACGRQESAAPAAAPAAKFEAADGSITARLAKYATVRLTTDLSKVSPEDQRVLGHFINAAERINGIYWRQSYGDPKPLLDGIADADLKRL